MVLVDTSVWIDHFRNGNSGLVAHLEEGTALCHPFVVGELACGNLQNRNEVLGLLEALPVASVAEHGEVLHLLEEWRLFGRGLGWVDAHILASARLSGCGLLTLDKALAKVIDEIDPSI